MRKLLVVAIIALSASVVLADFPEGNWAWFTLSPDDPYAKIDSLHMQLGDTFTLHAWQKCDDHDVAGMEFVIGWDDSVIVPIDMQLDVIFDPFMFKGTNFPGDTNAGTVDTLPAARWYAAVCIEAMGCTPLPAGEPYHVGTITFVALVEGYHIIDTVAYPPSSHTSMADPPGTTTTFPQWDPINVLITGVEEGEPVVPVDYYLSRAVPNPSRSEISLEYGIPRESDVEVSVYDATGRKVAVLVNGRMKAGRYRVRWNGRDGRGAKVPSGTYFFRLEAPGVTRVEKVLLLK